MSDNDRAQTLRINGPADLLQAVPYLLGFHPADSIVLVGLADGRLVVTVRIDLADLAEPNVLADAVRAMCRGGTEEVVAAIYDESGDYASDTLPWSCAVHDLGAECDDCGCLLGDVLRVASGRWWSYACTSPDCCPPEGRPMPQTPSPFIAAATYAGMVALADRGSLTALLDPLPDERRDRLEPLVAGHENDWVQAVIAGHAARTERSVKRAIFAAARRTDERDVGPALSSDEVARFGAALSLIAIRDSVWMAVDDGRLNGRELWRDLARQLPSPYDAPPLFLYGWASWRAGNGALATIAVERAIASDPTYSAADLLGAALARGVDPRGLPRLKLSRSA